VLDLFQPPAPVALRGDTRRVLLLDAKGEVNPDRTQNRAPRPSKFAGWTPEQYREYRREQQRARARLRVKPRTPQQEAYAQRRAYLAMVEQQAAEAAVRADARRRIEDLMEARALQEEAQ
jgi:hypothetical protein